MVELAFAKAVVGSIVALAAGRAAEALVNAQTPTPASARRDNTSKPARTIEILFQFIFIRPYPFTRFERIVAGAR